MKSDISDFITKELHLTPNSDKLVQIMGQLELLLTMYQCAIKEVQTKFEVLNDEFSVRCNRNPIHTITSRVKDPISIYEKLQRKNIEFSLSAISNQLNDIAGIRVVCEFVNDIYEIASMLGQQDDLKVLGIKDYIKNPKPNGYRSYHMIIEIPVFFSSKKQPMKVEVQLRTIAMDFWASLEHELKYKKDIPHFSAISDELLECANSISELDGKMQKIRNDISEYPVTKELCLIE